MNVLKKIIEVVSVVLSFISIFVLVVSPFAVAKTTYAVIAGLYLSFTIACWITWFVLDILNKKHKYAETNIHYLRSLEAFGWLRLWFVYGFKKIYEWIVIAYNKLKK